jgi:hypothetical protein
VRTLLCGAGLLLVLCAGEAPAKERPLDRKRIQEVAAMLPEEPTGLGRPITDRKAWGKLASREAFKKVIPRAERFLKEPMPEMTDEVFLDCSRTGNRTRGQKVMSRRRSRVGAFTLAECLENRGRFVKALEETVASLCAERTWVYPAHDKSLKNFKKKVIDIDLASSRLGWNLATARYLLGDALSVETRKLIRDHVRKRSLDPFADMVTGKRKPNWWLKTTNNWNAVCLAGVTGSALALAESREERAMFVAAAEKYSRNFLKGFAADGYCSEGLGYWNYGFGRYIYLAETVHQATGGRVDFIKREAARKPAMFPVGIGIINDVYPAFADCKVTIRPKARAMWYVSRRLGLGLREWEERDVVTSGGSLFEVMLYAFPNSASKAKPAGEAASGPGPRSWFDKAGILVCRPGPKSSCRMGAALKGGHNAEHHNHNDVGSYVVVVGSQPVLLDPGSEVYTSRTFSGRRYESKVLNSYGHPVPVVAGKLQRTGGAAKARVLRTDFTDERDTLVLDVSSAYDVPALSKLTRTFTFSRKDAGSLGVRDEVVFKKPQTFGTALVTLGKWEKLGDTSLVVRDGDGAVRVTVDTGGAPFEIKAEEIKEKVRTKTFPTRIGIDLAKPVKRAVVTLRIEPH